MANIKSLHREAANWSDYLPWIIGVAAVILITLAIFWWMAAAKRQQLRKTLAPDLPADQWAVRNLAELEQQRLWQQGRIKEYYSALSDILRWYFEKRYGIRARETTTDGLLRDLSRHTDFPLAELPALSGLLQEADLAKYAKAIPPDSFHPEALAQARRLVDLTAAPVVTAQNPQQP